MARIIAIAAPIAIIAVLGVGGVAVLSALKPEPEKAEEARIGLNVFAEKVRKGDLQITVEAQGEVRPRREIIVAPQISGRIAYVSPDFIDGGFIKQGQLLVRVEAADYELAVVRARSGVASAEQGLTREIAEAELAQQDIEDLGITNVSPLARREPQLAQARAALDAAKAQLKDAELALERTAVYAPFSGRVWERDVDIGQVVATGQSLGRIFANDVVEVSLPLDDEEMGRLGLPLAFAASETQPGPKVDFSAVVGGVERHWTGEVVRTAAAVNSQTRQINVIAELKDPYGKGADNGAPMAPGLFVNAVIEGKTIPDVLIAPRAALRGDDRIFIGNADEGTLSIRTVDLIYSDTDGAYVRSGIEPGEFAITSPIQAAFDGMNVTVMERQPDGTIKTYEPTEDTSDDKETEETAMRLSSAKGASE
ncbi:efflux RND transporter periplasmic adaptor subunit [Hyphomonas sp.]|uniref:efflux RND transporter periplasmic adaptor subunit n=1 Tax=Hyphomonas sp. TaxID=87 RepID=UPI000C3E22E4|nr:efflux RND transporter periplasmic adaptor subunit [Hyphomonas sp.]MAB11392.1 efflux transporter periplasmic adaptor subunit [Hyphomonas sp.]MAU66053.1 efflux transporter periplasmic adaptor subunit [Hyphomonas sp.]